MMKFALRHNLIYPLMLIIFNLFRKVDLIVLDRIIKFKFSLLITCLMFLGEFIVGLIIYIYQISFLPIKKKNTFMGIKLIQGPADISHPDSNFKIYLLLFMASFFDFVEFMMSTFYLPQIIDISKTLEMRLSSLLTISSAFFFAFLLKFKIQKHQIFSLSIIFICLLIIIILEYVFQIFFQEKSLKEFGKIIGSIFLLHFFNSLLDSIEKYLLEYNYLNPFKTLMIEGLFGMIFSSIYSIIYNPFKEIKEYYVEKDTIYFIFLIILLALYIVLSGGRNAYRVATNKIYSPMTKTLTDYFLNPLYIIYYFIFEGDFEIGERTIIRYSFFITNLILSIIIVFCGCIYNEILILFCFNLEHETHRQVTIRAQTQTQEDFENVNNKNDKENDNNLSDEEKNDDDNKSNNSDECL